MAAHCSGDNCAGKEIVPGARSCVVSLDGLGISLKLDIPYNELAQGTVYEVPAAQDPGTDLALATELDTHRQFRLSSIPIPEGAEKQAKSELKTIRLFFPQICSVRIRICMAAWLGTLCDVDDLIEAMGPSDAASAISGSLAILQDEVGNGVEANRISTLGKVLYAVQIFRDHCSRYLDKDEVKDFLNEVCSVFKGFSWELELREKALASDLETYINIRMRTVGVAPFFSLIKSEYSPGYHAEELLEMQRDIYTAVGLQNDLIGLEKDIQTGEAMNAVIYAMKSTRQKEGHDVGIGLPGAVSLVCELHNTAITRALKRHDHLISTPECPPSSGIIIANAMLLCTATHLEWCVSTKQYRGRC
ncbi:hypothetical protein PHISCL_02106 [Aspergillus sclerotialis]|uniref:Uncharacterized protein n=1 Tax=Aspergillus sclerotialis TaxID=2070753 RepID=A0A3A2ZRC7_9EURO|nr:hypothetical protein PHISCL_02106 [Aspergillus sclerotialis]